MSSSKSCLPACFSRYSGAVLELAEDGVVVASNGWIERELGRAVVGAKIVDLLEEGASRSKWERMREGLAGGESDIEGRVWELAFSNGVAIEEPRAFMLLHDDGSGTTLLIEQHADPRLDDLREQVIGVNAELSYTQRQLLKERGRLAHALDELEAQHRTATELADRVQQQNVELERSNRALEEFAQVVSHDLRAPLRSIANHVEWLEEDAGDSLSEQGREHLGRMRQAAARLAAMVNGVLEYARAGRTSSPPEPIDSRALVEEIVDLIGALDPSAARISDELPVFVGDRVPFQQVMLNLVSNAVRYADPADPRLSVEVRTAGSFFEFSVADNGPGVAPGDEERIWNLFEVGRSALPGGTGLGLAITRKLVEAQNGRAWVEPTPGGGATFRFLWPRGSRSASAE